MKAIKVASDRGTRERILSVAETFFAERGYHGTRIHEIAQQVGIQKASLFHHFPSKAALYRAVLERGVAETEETLQGILAGEASPQQKARMLAEAYVDAVAAHPQRTRILLRQSLGDSPVPIQSPEARRLLGAVAQFVIEGQRAKVFEPADAVAMILGLVGMVAFFFTSAHVFAPAWPANLFDPGAVQRVKRHVTQVVMRCLLRPEDYRSMENLPGSSVGLPERQPT